ncbi:MAG: hypothetical protein KGJ09_10690 [Candidatus Omnitrophica bacterium]|nr:hypothetical protein [Candidatus Omnitrophota bacterium]
MFSELSLLGRLGFVASAIAAIGLVYSIWHHTIYKSGEIACETRNAEVKAAMVVKGNQNHAKAEKKVMSLSTTALDRALSKWLYE